jgi:hypothetical protein
MKTYGTKRVLENARSARPRIRIDPETSRPGPWHAMPLGDSEMATDAFWPISAPDGPEHGKRIHDSLIAAGRTLAALGEQTHLASWRPKLPGLLVSAA